MKLLEDASDFVVRDSPAPISQTGCERIYTCICKSPSLSSVDSGVMFFNLLFKQVVSLRDLCLR